MAPIGGSKGIEDAARAYGIDRLSRPRKGDSTEAPGGAGESPSDAVSLSDQAKSLAAARKAVHDAFKALKVIIKPEEEEASPSPTP